MNAWTERRSSLRYTGAITNPCWASTEPEGQINTKGGSEDELSYPFFCSGMLGLSVLGSSGSDEGLPIRLSPLFGAQCFSSDWSCSMVCNH